MVHFGSKAYSALFRDDMKFDDFSGLMFFDRAGQGDIREFLDIYLEEYERTRSLGYISIPSGNHDIRRLRVGRQLDELIVAFAFLLTMPGIPFIYYGDEIGMQYVPSLVSKEGGYDRTGARTPMQWDDSANAGFSTASAEQLYLPIDADPDRPTVAGQQADEDSLLQHVRKLITLRKDVPALGADGSFTPLYAAKGAYPFVYLREVEGQKVLVAVNPSGQEQHCTFALPAGVQAAESLYQQDADLTIAGGKGKLTMSGVSFCILELRY
jgi:maltose alpha-D-glucosyltransferase/alpha-amylase